MSDAVAKSPGHPLAKAIGAAWDGKDESMWPRERRALCELAHVEARYAAMSWQEIPAEVRHRLITIGIRSAMDFGAACARIVVRGAT